MDGERDTEGDTDTQRQKEKDRATERERERDRDKEKQRQREERESEREKDRVRKRERQRQRERERETIVDCAVCCASQHIGSGEKDSGPVFSVNTAGIDDSSLYRVSCCGWSSQQQLVHGFCEAQLRMSFQHE